MPCFTKEFLSNKLFLDQAISYDRMGAYKIDGKCVDCGAFPQENGDVNIRLYVPGGETVRMHVSVSNMVFADINFEAEGNGLFEGVIPYDERMTGPANVKVYVNGAETLVPDLPVIWTDNRPQNNVEIPDPDAEYLLHQNVPHGTYSREVIYSHSTGQEERCMVYTPPGYKKSGKSYPVLYLLHGGGDNELMWDSVGKMSSILDNLWAAGKAVPFIVVMMNGMLRRGGKILDVRDRAFEEMLIGDCIPFIEANYRVKTDKWNRAIAGLSMGAYMSCDIGFGHPDLFGSIGTFTASMTAECGKTTYERPYPGVLREGAAAFAHKYKLYFRSTTPQENHLDFFDEDDRLLKRAGIDSLECYNRILYPPRTSKWNSWRMGLRDFAQLVFQA